MKKTDKKLVFTTGVNLAPLEKDGEERRFEAGDEVPELTKAELAALKDVIEEAE